MRKHISVLLRNRQGDKIAIPVRYALADCSSVHHLFPYEVSFFSVSPRFSFFTQSRSLKRESFGVSREATGEQIPVDTQKKNKLQKGACNTTVNCIRERGKKCND